MGIKWEQKKKWYKGSESYYKFSKPYSENCCNNWTNPKQASLPRLLLVPC